MVAHIRSFLKFAATSGEAPTGLDRQIDTPRVYREEKLPKSLPWVTVQALLKAVDRTTPSGIRDYAIFVMNADGRVVTWNDGAARITGYSA